MRKLSDAIMLGSMVIERRTPASFCGCAIGMGVASLTGRQEEQTWNNSTSVCLKARQYWPMLAEEIHPPDILTSLHFGLTKSRRYPVEWIISYLFCLVCDNMMSLESLVDMVRDIESQFPEQSIEQPTTTAALEPVPVPVH